MLTLNEMTQCNVKRFIKTKMKPANGATVYALVHFGATHHVIVQVKRLYYLPVVGTVSLEAYGVP